MVIKNIFPQGTKGRANFFSKPVIILFDRRFQRSYSTQDEIRISRTLFIHILLYSETSVMVKSKTSSAHCQNTYLKLFKMFDNAGVPPETQWRSLLL